VSQSPEPVCCYCFAGPAFNEAGPALYSLTISLHYKTGIKLPGCLALDVDDVGVAVGVAAVAVAVGVGVAVAVGVAVGVGGVVTVADTVTSSLPLSLLTKIVAVPVGPNAVPINVTVSVIDPPLPSVNEPPGETVKEAAPGPEGALTVPFNFAVADIVNVAVVPVGTVPRPSTVGVTSNFFANAGVAAAMTAAPTKRAPTAAAI